MQEIYLLRGVPAAEGLEPIAKALSREYGRVLDHYGWRITQYAQSDLSDFNGFIPLKRALGGRFGLKQQAESRVICSNGGMETFSLLLKSLRTGSKVAVDALTYDRVLSDIDRLGHRAVGVRLSSEGADLNHLEEVLRSGDIRLFYQVAYHHNPTGLTTSMTNLEEASQLCESYGALHVLDIAYCELRYDGKKNEFIDLESRPETTCIVGSFTKTISPGAKCGFGIFPGSVVKSMTPVIANTRLNPNYPTQAAIYNLIDSGFYDEHLSFLEDLYGARMRAVNEAVEEHLPDLEIPTLTGGFFLGVWLTGIENESLFLENLRKRGVVLGPANVFAPGFGDALQKERGPFFRLTFPAITPEENKQGIALLAETYREMTR